MNFKATDFDAMRNWLKSLAGSAELRRARLNLFDRYRYREDYESMYQFIEYMGGKII